MPLTAPACNRQPLHTRSIRVQTYVRDDGQFDLEAELIDTKAYDFPIRGGQVHPAGAPVHHMHLRVTIDAQFNITDAQVAYDAAPYGEFCSAIAPEYGQLVGLNLLNQFRKHVRERFGRTAGCTHVTELTNVLPTVAIQTMAGRRRQDPDGQRPFQLDGCHALRVDGPVVRQYYVPWYEPAQAEQHEG
ncbi:DUF2889 domain-containing protein [Castellaniella caeni]|uniref:DUF2889 domain-containing protein n=1 Tax=Castellaniella caeni TaxID=266123 RepID=UPI0008330320|nr:DUF2889 domain-containing protein [Castellaniella caeni]